MEITTQLRKFHFEGKKFAGIDVRKVSAWAPSIPSLSPRVCGSSLLHIIGYHIPFTIFLVVSVMPNGVDSGVPGALGGIVVGNRLFCRKVRDR